MIVVHKFKAFESREAARAFQREKGGALVGSDRKFSRDKRMEWSCAVDSNGLDPDAFPFAVVWNETVEG